MPAKENIKNTGHYLWSPEMPFPYLDYCVSLYRLTADFFPILILIKIVYFKLRVGISCASVIDSCFT